MSQDIFTKELFHQHLRKMWADHGFSVAEDEHVGVSLDELIVHSAERNALRELPYVDLWVLPPFNFP